MNQPLLTVLPLSAATLPLASSLLAHLATQGPIHHHTILFVADASLTQTQLDPLIEAAKPIYPAGGQLIRTPLTLTGIAAFNHRFETAASHIATHQHLPWLWLDPHCVPVRSGWLVALESAYFSARRPVMGQVMSPAKEGTAQPLVASTAIYPPELPKRVHQRLITQRSTAEFEKTCADLLVPLAAHTPLVWTHPLNGSNDLPKPPNGAVLVNTNEAKRYAAALRGEKPVTPVAVPKPVVVAEVAPIVAKPTTPASPPRTTSTYYHSGDLGDIIYALSAIKLAGGGGLLLGPQLRRTSPPSNPLREDRFDLFKPLLAAQPYLTRVAYADRYPSPRLAFDLNVFRNHWVDPKYRSRVSIHNLARMHCHVLGVEEKFHPNDTWLTVPTPIFTGYFVIHRSARFRSESSAPFPWPMVLRHFCERLLFVGLPQEHADFQRDFNVKVGYWRCVDYLELARVIAGSLGFIGNQSFPCAIALACGQRVLQEQWPTSPDCTFQRHNFLAAPFAEGRLDSWSRSTLSTPSRDGSHRHVSIKPINGVIELGPQADAPGLGDTLAITPLADRLGSKAVMCLPEVMRKYAPLFDGLCPVRITEDYPVFTHEAGQRVIESKLRMFGFECEDGKTVPVIKLTAEEQVAASARVGCIPVHTECKAEWMHLRSRPDEWFAPIFEQLDGKITRFPPTMPVRQLAAHLQAAGVYLGVNTGPWHLAMAMGCRCLVIDADRQPGYEPDNWRYNLPNVRYVPFDQDAVIAALPWLLDKA